ncbi:MAG: hypothetical protein Q9181_001186 [Wetmoreana brouardii]
MKAFAESDIARHEFPAPSIPLPTAPPSSVREDIVKQDPLSQDSQNENAVPESPATPSTARLPSSVDSAPRQSDAAISAPVGTLPPQLLTLLASIQLNLRDSFPEAPPHTAQRLAELILRPRSHYRTLPSYLRALDRVVSVSSPTTVFPLPSAAVAAHGSYLNGTMTPASTSDVDPDEALGGAALTPIPWLRETLAPSVGERVVGSDLRRESTSVIDGPNGVGSVETVTVAVNGSARQTGVAVTQGELIRQEQEAGVVPVPMARTTAAPTAGRGAEDEDVEEQIPHARGPEVIGMEDMGPQASSAGFDVEAALGRKGEGEAPPSKRAPAEAEEKEPDEDKDKDGEGDFKLVDADGSIEEDEKKADSVGQNMEKEQPKVQESAVTLRYYDQTYAFAKFQTSLQGDYGEQKEEGENPTHTIPTFLALYIFGFLYQLVLVYDALRLKNTIQVIGLCIYNVGLLIYAAVQMSQIHDAVNLLARHRYIDPTVWDDERPYLIAIPCIIALGTVLLSIVAWKLYDEFAWTIYKHISADLRMKRRYLTFQIYIALLKFDFFLFLGFTIQFIVVVVHRNNSEFYLTIAAIPVTIIILIMAGVFTRKENTPGMLAIIVLYFAGLAYFLFKLVRMYQPGHRKDYDPVRRPLTTFAVMTVILIILTIINACMCTYNFGRGLKPHIAGRKLESEEEKFAKGNVTEMPNYNYGHGYGPGPGTAMMGSRMTID